MNEQDQCFDDILLVPQYSELDSRTSPSLITNIGWMELNIPIISAPMDSITGESMLYTMDLLGGLGILSRIIGVSEDHELESQVADIRWASSDGAKNIGCAIGIKGDVVGKAKALMDSGCNVICIDVAHGDHVMVYKAIELLVKLKDSNRFVLMVGNVCSSSAVHRMACSGVDAIKVGIGPGAACTTRTVTGFGRGQLSAIQDAYYEGLGGEFDGVSIIADGGIRKSGDMVKALWAGASACMVGYILAGTSEACGVNGRRAYRGMSSHEVSKRNDIAPEGISISVPDMGETKNVIERYVKGIRSGLAMGGAENLDQLREYVTCVTVSPLAMKETLPVQEE